MKFGTTLYTTHLNRPLQREELAWAGGLFAGEGNFNCTLSKSRVLTASIDQSYDTEVLERFWESIGGIGRVQFHVDVQFRWRVSGFERVQFVAALLWPWLCSPKQEDYVAAITKWRNFGA